MVLHFSLFQSLTIFRTFENIKFQVFLFLRFCHVQAKSPPPLLLKISKFPNRGWGYIYSLENKICLGKTKIRNLEISLYLILYIPFSRSSMFYLSHSTELYKEAQESLRFQRISPFIFSYDHILTKNQNTPTVWAKTKTPVLQAKKKS